MGKNSAEYMRAYRAKRKAAEGELSEAVSLGHLAARHVLLERIAELEEEVRHLKAELAERSPGAWKVADGYGHPVVSVTTDQRASQQASRDAILRKINRGG